MDAASSKQPTNQRTTLRPYHTSLRPLSLSLSPHATYHEPKCPLKTENDQNASPASAPAPSRARFHVTRLPSVHAAKLPRYYICGPPAYFGTHACADNTDDRYFCREVQFCCIRHNSKRRVPSSPPARPYKGGGLFFARVCNKLWCRGCSLSCEPVIFFVAGLCNH